MQHSYKLSRGGLLDIDLCKASVAICLFTTIVLKEWSIICYVAQAFMILMVAGKCAHYRRVPSIGLYVGWYGLFIIWCLLSTFWAVSPQRTLSATVGIVQFVVLGSCLAIYILLEHDIHFVINCFAWSSVGLLVLLVGITPRSEWTAAAQATLNVATDANRIGYSVGYHPNNLAHLFAICSVIWFYKYRTNEKKPIYLLFALALFVVILFTKSRLQLVVALAFLAIYLLLGSRNFLKRAGILLLIVVGVFAVFWAIFNIPFLYQLVGFRFIGLFGNGSADASTTTREQMTQIAFELFSQHPFTGVGFANYAVYYYFDYNGWAMTYAHSNYAELLADLGIPGIIAYYAIPVWVLVTLLKTRRKDSDIELHALLTAAMICLLIADYSGISYTDDFMQLLWAAAFAYALGLKTTNSTSRSATQKESKLGYIHASYMQEMPAPFSSQRHSNAFVPASGLNEGGKR